MLNIRLVCAVALASLLSGCFGSSGSFHTVGGSVTGLSGTGLVLELQLHNDIRQLAVNENGAFVFPGKAINGRSYEVAVLQHPENEICLLENASGMLGRSDVNDVVVECASFLLDARPDFGQVTLEWAFDSSADIRYSTDPDCDWDNYSTCPGGEMLMDAQSGLTLDRSDGLVLGRGYYFVMEAQDMRSQAVAASPWSPAVNGSVDASVVHEGRWYVGGDFTLAAPLTGSGALLDGEDGGLRGVLQTVEGGDSTFFVEGGKVFAVVPDDRGGWFIGGTFNRVGGELQWGLARIRADGTVDTTWSAGTREGAFRALAFADGILYAGGNFDRVNGYRRENLVAVDGETGELIEWLPDADRPVWALEAVDGIVYAGGGFTEVNGEPRQRLAAIDASTGELLDWDPAAGGVVRSLAHADGVIFAGGAFTEVSGEPRSRLAAIDAHSGAVLSGYPEADRIVRALSHDQGRLYIGGSFTEVGGQPRPYLAAVDTDTAELADWRPEVNASVHALAAAGGNIYAGGDFTGIAEGAADWLAAFDADGELLDWYPAVNGAVWALGAAGSRVYAGGDFSRANIRHRAHLAAFNTETGALTNWNPGANNRVLALLAEGNRIYAGGLFTHAGDEQRSRLAAFDAATGALKDWHPPGVSGGNIRTLALAGDTIYAGGGFLQATTGETRERLAAFDVSTGALLDWAPAADDTVRTLMLAEEGLYAGGDFQAIDGQEREHLASFVVNTGNLTDWNPGANSPVLTLTASNNRLFVGGIFTRVDGLRIRERLAAFELDSGELSSWDPGVDKAVLSVFYSDGWVYAGGLFERSETEGEIRCGLFACTFIGEQLDHIAALNAETGKLSPWNPLSDDTVRTVVADGQKVYAGGLFMRMGGENRERLAISDFE